VWSIFRLRGRGLTGFLRELKIGKKGLIIGIALAIAIAAAVPPLRDIDIICYEDGKRVGVQCKRHSPVREVSPLTGEKRSLMRARTNSFTRRVVENVLSLPRCL